MRNLRPQLDGPWEGEFETEDGRFFVRVPGATLRRCYEEELERLGVPTDKPEQLIKEAERLRDRQLAVWLQVQEIDYWRQRDDPEVRIRLLYYKSRSERTTKAD